MIKRYFILLLLAVCCLSIFPPAARADVLVEPNNDFYSRHRHECVRVDRSFYANGEGGFASLKKEPGSNDEVIQIVNGEILYIMLTYNRQGELWGATEIFSPEIPPNQRPNGWISMEQLLLKYDYISFEEDHWNEIYPIGADYEQLPTEGDLVFWSWPGSGIEAFFLEEEWRSSDVEANWLQPELGYRDSAGREWGLFTYVYGARNLWACLSDPSNRDIPAFNPEPAPELWQASATDSPPGGLSTPLLLIILVVALAMGTAVLIRVFWKPKK